MAPLTDSLRETVSAGRPAQDHDAQLQGSARFCVRQRVNTRTSSRNDAQAQLPQAWEAYAKTGMRA